MMYTSKMIVDIYWCDSKTQAHGKDRPPQHHPRTMEPGTLVVGHLARIERQTALGPVQWCHKIATTPVTNKKQNSI